MAPESCGWCPPSLTTGGLSLSIGSEGQRQLHCEGPDFVLEEAQVENARIGPGLVVSPLGQSSYPHCHHCSELAGRQEYLALLPPVIFP